MRTLSLLDTAFVALVGKKLFTFEESFEFAGLWPGTAATQNPVYEPALDESFEFDGGWPGTT